MCHRTPILGLPSLQEMSWAMPIRTNTVDDFEAEGFVIGLYIDEIRLGMHVCRFFNLFVVLL